MRVLKVYRKGLASSRKCLWSCTLLPALSSFTTTCVVFRPEFTSPSRTWNNTGRDRCIQEHTQMHKQTHSAWRHTKTRSSHARDGTEWTRTDGHTQSRYTRMERTDVYSWEKSMSWNQRGGGRTRENDNMLNTWISVYHTVLPALTALWEFSSIKLRLWIKGKRLKLEFHAQTLQVTACRTFLTDCILNSRRGLTFPNQPFPISFR